MIIKRIDHVSIAVKDYEKARRFFQDILGAIPCSHATDSTMNYRWQLFSLGDLSRFEILTPTAENSYLDGFFKDRHGGVHHITLQTQDIVKAKSALDAAGIPYFGEKDYGDVWKEIFIHPKHAFGVLIQIAQFNPDDWLAENVRMPDLRKFEVDSLEEGCSIKFAHPGGGTVNVRLSDEEAKLLIDKLKNAIS